MNNVVLADQTELAGTKINGDLFLSRNDLVGWLFESIDLSSSDDGKEVLRLVARSLRSVKAP